MAFGLTVVTSNVGGITDFFVDGINGYITDSLDPVVFASIVENIINDSEKMKRMALNNYKYTIDHFYSHKVIVRIEDIC